MLTIASSFSFKILLFILGAIFGSFLNVVALRYDGESPFFSGKKIGGRSRCPHCLKNLRSLDLVPFFSYLFLRGRCHFCQKKISPRYFLVELTSGLLFLTPLSILYSLDPFFFFHETINYSLLMLAGIHFLTLITLFFISLIDLRDRIIPDQSILFIILLALISFFFNPISFTRDYASLFLAPQNILLNHLFAAGLISLIFLALFLFTKGRGIGFGDVKLAPAVAFLLGYPDCLIFFASSFLIGGLYSIFLILRHLLFPDYRFSHSVPFGPFLALGYLVTITLAIPILQTYFSLPNHASTLF